LRVIGTGIIEKYDDNGVFEKLRIKMNQFLKIDILFKNKKKKNIIVI
tara:strand:+ start:983 stop:1123 length:141 start_codon:yes stop_codon:yes gene_type:complete